MLAEKEKINNLIKLSQNENPFGASPLVLKALAEQKHNIHRYPNFYHKNLLAKLADRNNVLRENVILAAGSIGIIDILIKAFVGYGENIVTSEKTFVAYGLLAKINGKTCKLAKMGGHTINVSNIISFCDDKTRLLFIANPNNPTGTTISHSCLHELLDILPDHIYVVIDEAYAEYVTDPAYPDSLELQKEFSNLIVLRTFSKIYGLAGLRIGYAFAYPDIIETLLQFSTPFSVNSLAALAAAAALDDQEFITDCASINEEERTFLYSELKNLDFNIIPSQANFVLVEFESIREKEKVNNYLYEQGVVVRDLTAFGVERGLRFTVGRPEENRHLVDCLKRMRLPG